MLDCLVGFDKEIFFWINTVWSNSGLDLIFGQGTHLGGRTAGFAFLVIILFISRSRQAFLTAALAYGLNALVFKTIKWAVLRPRPYLLSGAILRQPPELSGATDPSFPSGHTAIAFMFAAFFSFRYPRLIIPLYLVASVVGLSRIYVGLHYPSDVLAGAALGIFCAYLALAFCRRLDKPCQWETGANKSTVRELP